MRQLRARNYSIVGMICSAEPIMTKWKWLIALRLPAKVFIVNENGDYFWVHRDNRRRSGEFCLVRLGLAGEGAIRTLGRLLIFPFSLLFLLLYAFAAHSRQNRASGVAPEKIMKQIQITQFGGPEEMKLADAPSRRPRGPGAGEDRGASGVNFIDVYFRIGLYKADLPFTPGNEAAGTVESVGADVTDVKPGDRVAYAMASRSLTAEYALVPAANWSRCRTVSI